MQNRKQRESLRMIRTYFLAGMRIRWAREKPSFLPPVPLCPSTGRELLRPTMLDTDGEKSVLEVGDSAWLESGVLIWSWLLWSTWVITKLGSPAFLSCSQGPFKIGKLLDLKLFSGSTYWSWSSGISKDSDKLLPVSSWSDMVQLVMGLPRWADKSEPHRDTVEMQEFKLCPAKGTGAH